VLKITREFSGCLNRVILLYPQFGYSLIVPCKIFFPNLADFSQSTVFFEKENTSGAPPNATASTRQYHVATPLGGLPWGKLRTGSMDAHFQVLTAVPINSSQVVIKNAAR